MLYGHPLRSCVPAHAKVFQQQWQARAESCDRRAATRLRDTTERYDVHAKPLAPLLVDSNARIQDTSTKRWDKVGTVMDIGYSRDYFIRMPSGRVWWRNRRFLWPTSPQSDSPPDTDSTPSDQESSQPVQPRRSPRIEAKNPQVLSVKGKVDVGYLHLFYVKHYYVFVAPLYYGSVIYYPAT